MKTIVKYVIIFILGSAFLFLEVYLKETYAFFDAFFITTGIIVFFTLFILGLMWAILDDEE